MEYWINGILEYWNIGILEYWIIGTERGELVENKRVLRARERPVIVAHGSEQYWSIGILEYWNIGVLD